MVQIASMMIFPLKSFDGMSVARARVIRAGALEHDREWRVVRNDSSEVVNGKREPKLMKLRTRFQLQAKGLEIRLNEQVDDPLSEPHFQCLLPDAVGGLAEWLSCYLGYGVRVERNLTGGFPDDPEATGPTIVSTATLTEIGRWFELSTDEIRRRMRSNIELSGDGMPPFWEDRLYAEKGVVKQFKIGALTVFGTNPCKRCGVPQRDSRTGVETQLFQRIFCEQRRLFLPAWAEPSWFTNPYRAAVNTNIPEFGWETEIRVGDEIRCV